MTVINRRKLAESKGWTTKKDYRGDDYFQKNETSLWQAGRSYPSIKLWWVCADIIDGRYQNHRTYDDLETALENE